MECRQKKAREWQVRMLEDIKTNRNGKFVTLTFSDESIKELRERVINETNKQIDKLRQEQTFAQKEIKKIKRLKKMQSGYELDNQIATRAMRLFNERWRKKYKKAIRHWMITELGHDGTENIHLHGIIWTDESFDEIRNTWNYGYIWPKDKWAMKNNFVNAKTVNYIIKYITKVDNKHKYYKSIVLTSPGIGSEYPKKKDAINNKYKEGNTIETYRTKSGHKIAMPIYWRNKIYSEEEREKLWIEKLDKEIRYVGKEKIDVSKNLDDYWKTLKWYRDRNIEAGYGNNEKDWVREEYEKKVRELQQATRIKNAEKKPNQKSMRK